MNDQTLEQHFSSPSNNEIGGASGLDPDVRVWGIGVRVLQVTWVLCFPTRCWLCDELPLFGGVTAGTVRTVQRSQGWRVWNSVLGSCSGCKQTFSCGSGAKGFLGRSWSKSDTSLSFTLQSLKVSDVILVPSHLPSWAPHLPPGALFIPVLSCAWFFSAHVTGMLCVPKLSAFPPSPKKS